MKTILLFCLSALFAVKGQSQNWASDGEDEFSTAEKKELYPSFSVLFSGKTISGSIIQPLTDRGTLDYNAGIGATVGGCLPISPSFSFNINYGFGQNKVNESQLRKVAEKFSGFSSNEINVFHNGIQIQSLTILMKARGVGKNGVGFSVGAGPSYFFKARESFSAGREGNIILKYEENESKSLGFQANGEFFIKIKKAEILLQFFIESAKFVREANVIGEKSPLRSYVYSNILTFYGFGFGFRRCLF